MNTEEARARSARRILREPLLQFMALGALIFLSYFAISAGKATAARDRIVVDDTVVARLTALYEKQLGRAPEPDQLQQLIETYVREQVLYLEARRLHLDESDEIVRRRLVQKMEFLVSRPEEEPSETDLRAYYAAHVEHFRQPARVSFEHLYFSPDDGGPAEAAARAERALAALRAGDANANDAARGDAFPLQMQYSRLVEAEAVQTFGNTQIVEALFSSPVGAWSGPHASGYGLHLVRVSERTPETNPPFDEVADEVSAAYRRDMTERQSLATIRDISARYQVIRAEGRATP